jgi:predicted RNase H-like HicB family nuclease
MASRERRYTAYIQWNKRKTLYAGYIPGIGGTEAGGVSMEDLKRNLGETLAERLRERRERVSRQAPKPRAGWRRIDITV